MTKNRLHRAFLPILAGLCLLACSHAFSAESAPLPRTLVALYNGKTQDPKYNSAHLYLEMPANWLGYRMIYIDIREPLPALPDSVRGIVLWLNDGEDVPHPEQYLDWLERALDGGKKILLIGDTGVPDSYTDTAGGFAHLNRVLAKMGLVDNSRWVNLTYDAKISYADPGLTGFERNYGAPLPPYPHMQAISGAAAVHLQISNPMHPENPADLIVTGPAGGYISSGYAMYRLARKDEENEKEDETVKYLQWYVNPFAFMRLALGGSSSPVPDVTTLDGRRVFYSHMDGDGWNNLTEVEQYHNRQIPSSEVIYREVFSRFQDLPFSAGIIAAEMRTDCYGTPESEEIAKKILRQPNIEPASHTYSHPLYWRFFEGHTPEQEARLLKYYPPRPMYNARFLDSLFKGRKNYWEPYGIDFDAVAANAPYREAEIRPWLNRENIDFRILDRYLGKPRSYPCAPFDLRQEISGAADYISTLAPEGKKVKLVQWSGDTSPYESAIRIARESGLLNINGGDTRYDDEYPSYASVAPLGLRIGDEWQIYSSNSNENTYTKLWTDRFFGFRYLHTTVNNTETPWRVTPFNVYFHTYSGEREASLKALLENLYFARTKDIIPIFASQYAAIANGFYSAEIVPLAEDSWEIRDRGALQTMRFDRAALKAVDFGRSRGVIGQRHYQGSLYVALHPKAENPVIVLKKHHTPWRYPDSTEPYLIDSRWQIIDLQKVKDLLIISVQGFGKGEMRWKMPESGPYEVTMRRQGVTLFEGAVQTQGNGLLVLSLDTDAVFPVEITIKGR